MLYINNVYFECMCVNVYMPLYCSEHNKPAVIGDGVCVKQSSLPNANMGLWATRPFHKNQVITEYDGDVITWDQAINEQLRFRSSHFRSLMFGDSVIAGLEEPVCGRGGGSFANDNHVVNAKFIKTEKEGHRSGRTGLLVMAQIWLKATRDIMAGDEIFVNYGCTYWMKM